MFKKVEIWVLYLVVLVGIVGAIGFGALVRNGLISVTPTLPAITEIALFIAEIPSNVKTIVGGDDLGLVQVEDRFPEISGFQGEPHDEEIYLLFSRYDGDLDTAIVELVDLRSFAVIHTWSPDIKSSSFLVDPTNRNFVYWNRNIRAERYLLRHAFLEKDGGLIFKYTAPIFKIDACSDFVWANAEGVFHHSIEADHENNFWVPTTKFPFEIDEKYVQGFNNFSDDAITKLSPEGKVVFQKSVSQIFIDNGLEYLLFSVGGHRVGDRFSPDPIHLNDIEPVLENGPFWKQGDVFLSLRHQSMVLLYRPETNEILWKGTGHTYHQHDVDILDEHRIAIFNNNSKNFYSGDTVDGNNEVVIYDFETGDYSSYLSSSLQQHEVRTITEGRSQVLYNNDLFIEEQNYGRTLYFNADGSLKWQHVNRAADGKVYELGWSRILYEAQDIEKVHNLIAAAKTCVSE